MKKLDKKTKDYIVYTILSIVAIVVIAYIFTPSEKTSQEKGINTDLPSPEVVEMQNNKILSYEEAEINYLQDQQNRDADKLYDLGTIEGRGQKKKNKTSEEVMTGFQKALNSPQNTDNHTASIFSSSPNSSNHALTDLQKTTEDLAMQINDIKSQKADKQQSEMMELMYAVSGVKPQGDEKQANEVSLPPVEIKALPKSGDANISRLSRNSFRGIASPSAEKNTIKALVYGTQKLMSGQQIRLRLGESMQIGGGIIPLGAILMGICNVGVDRLYVTITSIEHDEIITSVQIEVYDTDGQLGIYLPGSLEMEAGRDIGIEVANAVGNSTSNTTVMYNTTPNAMEQVKADVSKGLIQGTFNYVGKRLAQIKVTVQDAHKVYLVSKK